MLDWCGAASNAEPGHPPGARRCTRLLARATRRSARCFWRKEPTSRLRTWTSEPRTPCSSAIQNQRCRPSLSHLLSNSTIARRAVREGGLSGKPGSWLGGKASVACWACPARPNTPYLSRILRMLNPAIHQGDAAAPCGSISHDSHAIVNVYFTLSPQLG